MLPDLRAAAVVLKSDHRTVKQRTLQDDIPDQALRLPVRRNIQHAESLYGLLVRLIIFAEELIPAAHCEHDAAVLHIILEIIFDILQESADQFLLSVRTASEQDDIELCKVDLVSR